MLFKLCILFCEVESTIEKWAMKCPLAFLFNVLRTVLYKEELIITIITI